MLFLQLCTDEYSVIILFQPTVVEVVTLAIEDLTMQQRDNAITTVFGGLDVSANDHSLLYCSNCLNEHMNITLESTYLE